MVRQLRIEYPGALYHVFSRGNAKEKNYFDIKDKDIFFDVLSHVVQRYDYICHAFCLMENHYHLILETPKGNLSRGMRHLNGVYTQKLNKKYERVGHFRGEDI